MIFKGPIWKKTRKIDWFVNNRIRIGWPRHQSKKWNLILSYVYHLVGQTTPTHARKKKYIYKESSLHLLHASFTCKRKKKNSATPQHSSFLSRSTLNTIFSPFLLPLLAHLHLPRAIPTRDQPPRARLAEEKSRRRRAAVAADRERTPGTKWEHTGEQIRGKNWYGWIGKLKLGFWEVWFGAFLSELKSVELMGFIWLLDLINDVPSSDLCFWVDFEWFENFWARCEQPL